MFYRSTVFTIEGNPTVLGDVDMYQDWILYIAADAKKIDESLVARWQQWKSLNNEYLCSLAAKLFAPCGQGGQGGYKAPLNGSRRQLCIKLCLVKMYLNPQRASSTFRATKEGGRKFYHWRTVDILSMDYAFLLATTPLWKRSYEHVWKVL